MIIIIIISDVQTKHTFVLFCFVVDFFEYIRIFRIFYAISV